MREENAIEVKDLKKQFKVYYDKGSQLKEKMLFWKRNRYENRQVLNGISFEVKKGEAVGLIGHNGCGKSTTLKLLTKIIYPTSGTVEMRGRVSSLIELGAGFHPDMSGRENIYTNAAIFGLSKREIEERLDTIIEFSELQAFIDNPVRTYSSGMYMRLAFAVAINVNADILLIDEILAVGDANFQAKCFDKLKEIKERGTTIIIVSHALGQIEQICERAIWIHDGLIRAEGPVRDVDLEYLEFMGQKMQESTRKDLERKQEQQKERKESNKNRWGNGKAHLEQISLLDADGQQQAAFPTGSPVRLRIAYSVNEPVQNAVLGIGIFRQDGVHCYGTNTRIDMQNAFDLTRDGTAEFQIDALWLLPGVYTLDVAIEAGEGIPVDYYKGAVTLQMTSSMGDVGVMRVPHQWKIAQDS